jgi:NADPH-dependent 2,4-dienoyl-CoA reductase/sulfur reductase-like enzyme
MRADYLIVGGGLAAASAVEGIRSRDTEGGIVVLTRENHAPYHRPPLSKGLWTGKDKLDELPVHDDAWYAEQRVDLQRRREVVELDPDARRVWDDHGRVVEYGELLLATGSWPRRLEVEGSELDGIHYYRGLEDYLKLADDIQHVAHVLVAGGGFIGLELAAAMRQAGKDVTLVYPTEYPLRRVLPRDLGLHVAERYRQEGVEVVSGEAIAAFQRQGSELIAFTKNRNQIWTQLVVVGAGAVPQTDLAEAAGLEIGNGVEVDELGRTTDRHVWAAGDVAEFPASALGRRMRVEHWDHAREHGRAVGANMAGANVPYTHVPMFWSDFFDLGWEAVGACESGLDVHAVWREPFREGVVFYLDEGTICGVLLWNVWGAVDRAREAIRERRLTTVAEREALAATFGS